MTDIINKYRKNLHNDSQIILIISIVSAIMPIILDSSEGIPIFLKAVLFLVMTGISISQKKQVKSFVGIYAIFTGLLMIITSIKISTPFDLIYLLLGIFYIIHAIKYLKELKKHQPIASTNDGDNCEKKSGLSIINLFVIVLSFVSGIVGISTDNLVYFFICIVALFFVLVASIVLCKQRKVSFILYVDLAISILGILIFAIFIIGKLAGLT